MNDQVSLFNEQRPHLYGIAYRMLGSKTDAEDMVQEAYIRWHRTPVERVQSPNAWLVTTITRLCIDRLRAAKTEREAYIGPWLPDPLVGNEVPAADAPTELASDLSVAFLVVLERLAPDPDPLGKLVCGDGADEIFSRSGRRDGRLSLIHI